MFEEDDIIHQSIFRFEFDNYGMLISKNLLTEANFAKINFSDDKTRAISNDYSITDQLYDSFTRGQ